MEVITNYRVYDLVETLVASGYAMIEEYNVSKVSSEVHELEFPDGENNKHYKRA